MTHVRTGSFDGDDRINYGLGERLGEERSTQGDDASDNQAGKGYVWRQDYVIVTTIDGSH